MIRSSGHIDMERVHVDRIAEPRQTPAARRDDQTCKQVDRAIGSMGAWQPLRIEERQRTRFHRHGLAHHEQPAIQIGQIDTQGQGAGIKDILRAGNFGRMGLCRAAQAKQRDSEPRETGNFGVMGGVAAGYFTHRSSNHQRYS